MTQYEKLIDDKLDESNYQKLLDDDADIFENFSLNKNDEFLEMIWSIQQDEKKNTTNLSEQEKKFEFKNVVEKRKNQLDTEITPAELGLVNGASVSAFSANIVNSENIYSRQDKSSTFPSLEQNILSNKQERPTTSTGGLRNLLYSLEETDEEHSLHKKKCKSKYIVGKNKSSEHNEKKEIEGGRSMGNNSNSSHFLQETNVSDYQTLLNDETLNAFEENDANLISLCNRNSKYESKFTKGAQKESVYGKQKNIIQSNSNTRNTSHLSLNVEKDRIPGVEIQPEIHNINKYSCFDKNSKDTEYTFKFVREKNNGNENSFQKDHLHSLWLQPLQVSKGSMLNGTNKQQNINNDFQHSINLYQANSFCNPSQTLEIPRESPNNNQDKLNYHYDRNYYGRIHTFKNKKIGCKKHKNGSNFQGQNFFSRTAYTAPNFLHIPNKHVNKLELNSSHSLTNNIQYLNASQTKPYSLLRDKQSCSGSLATNDQNICKLKRCNNECILHNVRVKSQAKKPKLKMDVESSLKNSIKHYYGVSKSLVENSNVRLSKNESTMTREQPHIFDKSKANNKLFQKHMKHDNQCKQLILNECDLNGDGMVKHQPEYIKQSMEIYFPHATNSSLGIVNDASISKFSTHIVTRENTLSKQDISSRFPELDQKILSNKQESSTSIKTNGLWKILCLSEKTDQENSLPKEKYKSKDSVETNKSSKHIAKKENEDSHSIGNYSNSSYFSHETNVSDYQTLLNDETLNAFEENDANLISLCNQNREYDSKFTQGKQIESVYGKQKNTIQGNSNTQKASQLSLNVEKDRIPGVEIQPEIHNINKYLCLDKNSKDTEYTFEFVREKNNGNKNSFKKDHLHSLSLQPSQVSKRSMLNGKNKQQNINNDFQNPCNHLRTFEIPGEYPNNNQDKLNYHYDRNYFRRIRTHPQVRSNISNNCCNTDAPNTSSDDSQLPLEYLESSQENIDYRDNNESKHVIDPKSSHFRQETNISDYQKLLNDGSLNIYEESNKFIQGEQNESAYRKQRNPIENNNNPQKASKLSLNAKKDRIPGVEIQSDQDQNNNNTQTISINSDNFELLSRNISCHNQDLSMPVNASRNTNNVHIKHNDDQSTGAKRNVIIDYINVENILDSPHYLFNSQGNRFTSQEQNSNNTKFSNIRSFSGENSEGTCTTVCDNTNNHILKEIISQSISNSNNESVFQPDRHLEMKYLKSFIEDKMRNIRDYLCRRQKQSNEDEDGSYINKVILNSLSNPLEDALLDETQSHELVSQSLTFTPTFVEYATMRSSQSEKKSNAKFDTPDNQTLAKAIDDLSKNKSLISLTASKIAVPELIKKMFILQKVSDLFSKLLSDIQNHRVPLIQIRDQTKWQNSCFTNNLLVMKPIGQTKNIRIKSNLRQGTSKFNLIIYIIGKITDLLINNQTCTKRELYYQLVKFVKHQVRVNNAVNSISCLLDEPHWDLGILATNKGLVYGDLTVFLSENEVIYCNIHGGMKFFLRNYDMFSDSSLIPQNQSNITKLVSNASFILVVEKDSIFQQLLDQDLPNALPRTFIMITGKGFADVSTRLFIKKLWHILNIPVLVLVDADPYGIEIMLTYRFGSLALAHLSEHLALPSLRWIGIHPKEIIALGISHQPLTAKDNRKIQELLKRPYINSVPEVKLELEIMADRKFKAEIEGAMKSNNYFKDIYIPRKLCAQEYF